MMMDFFLSLTQLLFWWDVFINGEQDAAGISHCLLYIISALGNSGTEIGVMVALKLAA